MFKGSGAHKHAKSVFKKEASALTKKSSYKKKPAFLKEEEVETNMNPVEVKPSAQQIHKEGLFHKSDGRVKLTSKQLEQLENWERANEGKISAKQMENIANMKENGIVNGIWNSNRPGQTVDNNNTDSFFESQAREGTEHRQFSRKELQALTLALKNPKLTKDEKLVINRILNLKEVGKWKFSENEFGRYNISDQSNRLLNVNVDSSILDYIDNATRGVYKNPTQTMEVNPENIAKLQQALEKGVFDDVPEAGAIIAHISNNIPVDQGLRLNFKTSHWQNMFGEKRPDGIFGDPVSGDFSQEGFSIEGPNNESFYKDNKGQYINTGTFNQAYSGAKYGYADRLFDSLRYPLEDKKITLDPVKPKKLSIDQAEMDALNKGGGVGSEKLTDGQKYFQNRYPGFNELSDSEKKQVMTQYFPKGGGGPQNVPGDGVLGQSGGPGLRTGEDDKITLDPIKFKGIKVEKPRITTPSGQPNFSANELEKGMGETNVGKDKRKFPTQQRRRLKQGGRPSLETIKPGELNVKNNVDLEMGKNKENFLKQSTDELKAKSKENKKQREQAERQAKLDKKRELNYNPQATASNNTNNRRKRGNAKGGGGGDFGSRTKEFLDNTIGSLFKGGGGGGNKLLPSTMAKKGKYNKGKKKK